MDYIKNKHFFSLRLVICLFIELCSCEIISQVNHIQVSPFSINRNVGVKYPMDILIDNNYKYWIASLNGLMEYDGNKLKKHHMPFYQNNLIGSDYIERILFENDSILWISHISGISKFNVNTKKFELIKIEGTNTKNYLNFIYNYKDSEGNLFFISNELKVLTYDKSLNIVRPHKQFNNDSLGFVFKIADIEGGNYLLNTRKGFFIFNKSKKRYLSPSEIPSNYKWILLKDFKAGVNDYVRIGNNHIVSTYDNKNRLNIIVNYNSLNNKSEILPIHSNNARLFFKDSFNRLWIYGFGDIAELYDPKTNKVIQIKAQDTDNITEFTLCYDIFEDHENNIWLSTNAGLLTFNLYENNIEVISKNLPSDIFGETIQLNNDILWFGTAYNGIYEYSYSSKKFKKYDFTKQTGVTDYNNIWQLYLDKNKINVWVIHTKGKLSRYNIQERKFYHYNDPVFNYEQFSISEDKSGIIHFVTESGKLIKYDKETNHFIKLLEINTLNGINPNIEVNDLVFIDSVNFVIGTSGDGLIKINFHNKVYNNSNIESKEKGLFRGDMINILKSFDDSFIYAGTANGILAYNIITNEQETFSYNEDFNLGFVYDICQDNNGNIIFIAGSELYMMNWKTKEIIDLGEKSNILRTSFTNVFYSDKLKKLYVLSEESIYEVTLNNKAIRPKIKPVIYSLDSYGKSYSIMNRNEVYLDKTSTSFRINFGSSTYKFKDDLEYYYNFNNEGWEPVASREVSFANLKGGDYNFVLKVVYKGNRAIFSEKKLIIHLPKKIYQTTWFFVIVIIAIIFILYIVYKIRVNYLLSLERVRLDLSRDLHDDMGSTLSTINILSTMALRKIDIDINATKEYLEKTSRYSIKMMDSMDDIVWSLNPSNDKMNKIIYRMREFASNMLEPRNIKLVFSIDEKVNKYALQMAVRRDFFLIFKEVINNAVKYSNCNQINIKLEIESNNLTLMISDNGIGINKNLLREGNGLTNMKKRAELLKGYLNIYSENQKGTTIILTINLNKL